MVIWGETENLIENFNAIFIHSNKQQRFFKCSLSSKFVLIFYISYCVTWHCINIPSCGVPFFKRTWPHLIRERFSSMPYWCLHSFLGDSFPRVWLYNGKYLICCSYIELKGCELQCLLFFYKTVVTGDDHTITPKRKNDLQCSGVSYWK